MNHNLVGEKSQDPKLLDVSNSGEYFIKRNCSVKLSPMSPLPNSSQIKPEAWQQAVPQSTVLLTDHFPARQWTKQIFFWFKISLCCVLVMYLLQM